MPREITNYIIEAYVDMRSRDKGISARSGGRGTMTARQLLSILRLAEALARLQLREDVTTADVDEAIRLVKVSKASVDEPSGDSDSGAKATPTDRIYRLIALKAVEGGKGELPPGGLEWAGWRWRGRKGTAGKRASIPSRIRGGPRS